MDMNLAKQLRIFLLHARSDAAAVRLLYRRLVRDGADVWLDQERLLPGQDWAYEIKKAIRQSDVVVACLSRQFNKQGGYRHEELRIALEEANARDTGAIFIVPARLEPCELPEPLRRWQRVDLFDANGYRQLLDAFHEVLVTSGAK
jgi:hypothetical protein